MPVNSDAPVVIEIALISGGQVVVLPGHQFVKSLVVDLTAGGAWTATVEMYDYEGDTLENLIIVAGLDRRLRFRFGRGDEYPSENLTFEGTITKYQPLFEAFAVSLTIEVVTRGIVESLVSRQPKAFAEGRLISDIVAELAALNGWATTDVNGRSTVEATKTVTKEPYSSTGESDLRFIRDQLIPAATNADGYGNYLFFFDESNTVHFHTREFLPPVQHEFVYSRSMSGDVISFAPEDVSLFGTLMGGGNSVFVGTSSLSGAPAQVTSGATTGVENEGSPTVVDATGRVDYGSGTHAYIDLQTRDPEELKRLAQSRYDRFREYGYKAELVVHGTHRVRTLDFANVRFLKANPVLGSNPEHYLSGLFRVYGIRHEIQGAWTTTFNLMRGGVDVSGTSPIQTTQQINPSIASNSGEYIGVPIDA